MDIEADATRIAARLDADDAAKLLQGLEAMQEEVGSLAGELIQLLRAAGVAAPPAGPVRSEYAGPQ